MNSRRANFVLVSTQRSGSTWVVEMLNSHPGVTAYEELFLRQSRGMTGHGAHTLCWQSYWTRRCRRIGRVLKPLYVFKYLDTEVYKRSASQLRSVGFKVMYGQLFRQYPYLTAYFLCRHISIIHLIRENYLDVYLSRQAAKFRGLAHSFEEVRPVRFVVDPAHLVSSIRKHAQAVSLARSFLSKLPLPYLEVTYEQLSQGQSSFGQILEFLGCETGVPLRSGLKKLNRQPPHDMILNFQEVKEILEGEQLSAV